MIAEVTQLHTTQHATTHYTVQYELLRSEVLGAQNGAGRTSAVGQPRAVGLALLLREGMPGWLKAVDTAIRTSLTLRGTNAAESLASEPLGRYESAPDWVSGMPRHDLTTLLASLVLSTRRLENSSSREGYRSCQ
jgi:hypothetical protein